MTSIPDDLRYTEEHEWMRLENTTAVCGITDHAQHMLNDIVFVEMPEVGRQVERKEQVAVIESVKAVSDVFSPVSGTVVAVNTDIDEHPELVNTDPYTGGWLFKIEMQGEADVDHLLSPERYSELVAIEEDET